VEFSRRGKHNSRRKKSNCVLSPPVGTLTVKLWKTSCAVSDRRRHPAGQRLVARGLPIGGRRPASARRYLDCVHRLSFVNGNVDTDTGRVSGRAALVEIVVMPILLAVGGTMIAGIWFIVSH
jgi:hypothetical protein